MRNDNETNASAAETSRSFVIRMWQEDHGQWRGTIRQVQSQAQMGFTQIEQATRFIQKYTTGAEMPLLAAKTVALPAFHFNLGFSQRSTKLLALAVALIVLSVVGLLAVGQANLAPLLGFGR